MGSGDSDTAIWITKGRQNKIRNNTVDSLLKDLLIYFFSGSFSYLELDLIILQLIEYVLAAPESISSDWLQVLIKASVLGFICHHIIMIN